MRKITPAWFLFLFAPITAEYLSFSSPLLNPIVMVVNLILYGCGTLMIRELRVRWHKGWLAVFIMGIAYTIGEEGLMLNTLFDPVKNITGRFAGVNWVWTAGMLLVHSLFSILLPILMAETVFADKAKESWIKPGTFWLLLAVYLANVFGLGRALVPHDRPGLAYLLAQLGIVAACLSAAKYLPVPKPETESSERSPRWYFFAFFIGTTVSMIAGFVVPSMRVPTLVQMGLMFGVLVSFLAFARRNHAFSPTLAPLSKLACASGMISFWILASPVSCAMTASPGPILVAIPMIVFLLKMKKRCNCNSLALAPTQQGFGEKISCSMMR